jgi:hypothetical protein
VVPRRLAGCAPAVRHRGVPLGAACCRTGARKGDVRPRLLLGGRDRDGGGCEGVSIRVPLISILIDIRRLFVRVQTFSNANYLFSQILNVVQASRRSR